MKNKNYIIFILALISLESCKKKEEEFPKRQFEVLNIIPVLKWNVPDKPIVIHKGHTINFNVEFSPHHQPIEMKVYRLNTLLGIKELLPEWTKTSFKSGRDYKENFKYIVNNTSDLIPLSFSVEITESTGITTTRKSIQFDSLSKLKVYNNLEIYEYHDWWNGQQDLNSGKNVFLMYDTHLNGIKYSSSSSELNYSVLLTYIQYDGKAKQFIPGISTLHYNEFSFTKVENNANYSRMTKFKILDNSISFENVSTPEQVKQIFETSTDTIRVFKKNFASGVIAVKIFTNLQQENVSIQGTYTYALIKIKENIPNDKLVADLKIYNPYKF